MVARILERGFQVYDMFETDEHGIFKARPGFDFSAIPRFRGVRVNPSGFRGSDFVPADPAETSVLFIGDSFTWGGAAMPIPGNCFVDIVERSGYHVWNAGIPGRDPNQYARIAEIHVPALRPETRPRKPPTTPS